ncbi:MAG TPA: ester cyclase [Chloroflexota bacterium]
MSAEDNKRLTRQFIEDAWNAGRYDQAGHHLAPDFANNTPMGLETREQFLARITAFRKAFPDFHMTVDDMLADGDRVITRWTGRGTHQGSFRGIAPTGRGVTVTGIAIDRLANSRRVEGWAQLDNLGLLQQLGATIQPPP